MMLKDEINIYFKGAMHIINSLGLLKYGGMGCLTIMSSLYLMKKNKK